jgi:hypothetical protein
MDSVTSTESQVYYERPLWCVKEICGYLYSNNMTIKFRLISAIFDMHYNNDYYVVVMHIPPAFCMDDITSENLIFTFNKQKYFINNYTLKELADVLEKLNLPDLSNIDIFKNIPFYNYLVVMNNTYDTEKKKGITYGNVLKDYPHLDDEIKINIAKFVMDIYNKCLTEDIELQNAVLMDIDED